MDPVTLAVLEASTGTRRPGRHRATKPARTFSPARAGALAAFAGAITMSVGATAQASAQPISHPAIPVDLTLPENLNLPPEVDALIRDLLPSGNLLPGSAVAPASGTVTSRFGPRWGTNHNGVDIAAPIGTPVYAVTDGVVLESGPASGFGQWIRVRQDDGTVGVFGHVDQSFVSAGQTVRAGEQIGTVGNRGHSTGPHLHYEVHNANGSAINPHAWLDNRGVQL